MMWSFRLRACCIAIAAFCCLGVWLPARAADGSAAQHRAAEEFLAAQAAGDARQMAMAIHQEELEQLRRRLVDEMKLEADRNESLLRARLFGAAMPLAEIERLTPQNFFATLAQRLRFGGRPFERIEWLAAVDDSGGMVQMVGRLRPPKELGSVRVPVVVSIIPWGKDWKAALPLELQAQIDDLRAGRVRAPGGAPGTAVAAAPAQGAAAPAAQGAPGPAAPAVPPAETPAAILELFRVAEENLRAGRCEDYYTRQMSPNFRRTTATKALRALITSCEGREPLRQQMIAAISIARGVSPRLEYAGTRAVFDLRGHGLPYPTLVLEQVDKRWYIAE